MPWFKVDDQLYGHKKSMRAGNEAMGLWLLAGSWCAAHLSDGFVPSYVLRTLATDSDADELAKRLEQAGFWEAGLCDGDEGWWFNDWSDYNPTADEVQAKRAASRERQERSRRHRSGDHTMCSADHCEHANVSVTRDIRVLSRVTDVRQTRESQRPDPTRPDPTPEGQDHAAETEPQPPPDGGVTTTIEVEGFQRPFPVRTRGTPLTYEIVDWAMAEGLADGKFRTDLEDAQLAIDTVGSTVGRKGRGMAAAIAVVGDYYAAIRGEPLNRRAWGMVQSAVSNHGPSAVLAALAEALQHGAGLDGGHEVKGPVAVVEYALAVLSAGDSKDTT